MTPDVFRPIREFLWPYLRCERIGHVWLTRRIRGYVWPGKEYRSVADSVVLEVGRCERCGVHQPLNTAEVISRAGIQSLTMGAHDWAALHECGFIGAQHESFTFLKEMP